MKMNGSGHKSGHKTSHKTKSAPAKKGVAGSKTGGATRKAIRGAEAKGKTHEQIGRSCNRSASTIGSIKSGDIKNPPKNLAKCISKKK